MRPDIWIEGARRAQHRLGEGLAKVNDGNVGNPSRCPGWTVGHVLTHLARNADGFANLFDSAAKGEVGVMYPGGAEQRTRDIEAGARRSAVDLCADVVEEAAKLEARWIGASEEMWAHGKGHTARGDVRLSETVFSRWREVEVHHVDLDLGYTWDDWPADYVREDLVRQQMAWRAAHGMADSELPPRALAVRPALRLAWLLGRAHIEGLQDVHF